MCRLFAMTAGEEPVRATFWLLEAPDSLTVQSHHNPDGTGLGTYRAGRPVVHKAPISAFDDRSFAGEARKESSTTFLAHVRFASTGKLTLANTHPFEQDGRLFAHNGVVSDLRALEDHLGEDLSLVEGQTDSERVFALITREVRALDGNLKEGIVTAARWIAENLEVYALNLILTTATEVYALRYPATHDLFILQRPPGGHHGDRALHHESHLGSRIHADDAATRPVVVLASEPMDNDPAWRELSSGELVVVSSDLTVDAEVVLEDPPARPLTLSDLDEHARASQATHP